MNKTGIPTGLHLRIAEWLWCKFGLDPDETLFRKNRDEAAQEIKKICDECFQEAIDELRKELT